MKRSLSQAMGLAALFGLAQGCGDSDLGITTGGSQDSELADSLIESGVIPDESTFQIEGLFSEHDLPLDGPVCSDVLCPRGAVAMHTPIGQTEERVLVQIGFGTNVEAASFARESLDVAAVVDVSCSMGGGKLDLARQAIHMLVDQLGPDDRMGLAQFGTRGETVLNSAAADSAHREALHAAIDGLYIDGSTALEEGLQHGYAMLGGGGHTSQRVMLFTDAQPNTGMTEASEFVQLTSSQAEAGNHLSLFGTGADLGVELASAVGQIQGANYYFLSGEPAAQRVFEEEFDYLVTPVAYDFETTVTPESGLAVSTIFGAPTGTSDIDFGASTLFLSSRSGGLGAYLDGVPPGIGNPVAQMRSSWVPTDGLATTAEAPIAWQGGAYQPGADQLGVFKMGLLIDVYDALLAGSGFCRGRYTSAEAVALIEEAQGRVQAGAETIGGDPALMQEHATLEQLRGLVAEDDPTRCY